MSSFLFPQIAVTQNPRQGIGGQIVDSQVGIDARLGWPDVDLEAGIGVALGAGTYQSIKPPTVSADITSHFQGFTLRSLMVEPRTPQYGPKLPCSVIRRGRVWIAASGDVLDDGPVFVVYTSNDLAGSPLGSIRGDVGGGGIAAALAPRCKVVKGASAGSTAIVSVNLP